MSKRGFTHEKPQKGATDEWFTPKWLFDAMGLRFDVDPCAPMPGEDDGYCVPATRRITKVENGLVTPWGNGRAFVNWPYSESPMWVGRVLNHLGGVGNTAITLSFNRSETEWAQILFQEAKAVLFLKGRIQFVPGNNWISFFGEVPDELYDSPELNELVVDVDPGTSRIRVKRKDMVEAIRIIRKFGTGFQFDYQNEGSAGAGNMLCAFGGDEARALMDMDAKGLGVLMERA